MATRDQVNAARSRGGKPSDANRVAGRTAAQDVYDNPQSKGQATASDGSIVERGPDGAIYRYVPKYGYTTIERDGNISAPMRGNQLPGGVNKYIDKVLDMSGMNDGASSGVPSAGTNIPTPTPRPSDSGMTGTENNPGKLADDTITPDAADPGNTATAADGNDILSNILLGTALAGGGYAAYKMFGNKGPQTSVDETIAAVDGDGADAENAPDRVSEAAQIEQERRKALPAPQQKIAGPSPVDETISAVDGDQPIAAGAPDAQQLLTDADAPYSPRNPAPPVSGLLTDADAPYSGRNPAPSAPTPVPTPAANADPQARLQLMQKAVEMPNPADAIRFLSENGINGQNLTAQEALMLKEFVAKSRAGRQAAGEAVSGAVRNAVRGAAR